MRQLASGNVDHLLLKRGRAFQLVPVLDNSEHLEFADLVVSV